MKSRVYNIRLEPLEDGRYSVSVPALGCATVGGDYQHALQMAKECIETYLTGLQEAGLPIPTEQDPMPFDTAVEVMTTATA